MKSYCGFLLLLVTALLSGCGYDDTPTTIDSYQYPSGSFYPMTVGNYWRYDDQSYTEITGTTTINGEVFYIFFSLIGGDVFSTQYLRIDSDNNLVAASPVDEHQYVSIKFGAKEGDSYVISNGNANDDLKVTIVEKTDDRIEFKFESVYQSFFSPYTVVYKKGFGLVGEFTQAKIDDTVYKFDGKKADPFAGH